MGQILKFSVDDSGMLKYKKVSCPDGKVPYNLLKSEVNGNVEYVYHIDFGENTIALAVDEEGLLRDLKPTFWLYNKKDNRINRSPLVGNVLAVKVKNNTTLPLSNEEILSVLDKIMVDSSGRYFLPLNNEYIKRSNEAISMFLKGKNGN